MSADMIPAEMDDLLAQGRRIKAARQEQATGTTTTTHGEWDCPRYNGDPTYDCQQDRCPECQLAHGRHHFLCSQHSDNLPQPAPEPATYPCAHGDPCECANPTYDPPEDTGGGIPIGPDPIPTGRPDYITGGYDDTETPTPAYCALCRTSIRPLNYPAPDGGRWVDYDGRTRCCLYPGPYPAPLHTPTTDTRQETR